MKAINIKWDTTGNTEVLETLPTEVDLPDEKFEIDSYENEDEFLGDVSEYLSDVYGYCHYGFELSKPFPKRNYKVSVTDSAAYVIRASSEEQAKDKAWEFFNERQPAFSIEITKEEAEVEI